MTTVTTIELGAVEKALLGAGLLTLGCPLPRRLRVDAGELKSPDVEERLVNRAFKDKMLPMLVRHAAELGWEPTAEAAALVEVYRRKMEALYEDLGHLSEEMKARHIEVLILKGSDLALSAYPRDLPRMMADIDLLIRPPDLARTAELMRQAGYVQGRLDMSTLELTPLSEAESRAIAENHYELAPFVRIRQLQGLDPYLEVIDGQLRDAFFRVLDEDVYFGQGYDVHFNVSDNIDVADIWWQTRSFTLPGGQTLGAQSVTALLWFTVARAYHEMMFASVPSIRQFVDVLAVLNAHHGSMDWPWLLDITRKYDLHPSLFYLFWHANELLGAVVPDGVIDACRPDRAEVNRFHDWGDPMPKLFTTTVLTSLLGSPEGGVAPPRPAQTSEALPT